MMIPEFIVLWPVLMVTMMAFGLMMMLVLMRVLRGGRREVSGRAAPLLDLGMGRHSICMGPFTMFDKLSDDHRPDRTPDTAVARPPTWSDGLSAQEVLRERYVRGEIDLETFERMLERIGVGADSGGTVQGRR